MNDLPGYDYGTARSAHSPLTLADLKALEQTAGFTDEDRAALKQAGEVLADQAEGLVDSWRAEIGKQNHLAECFFGPDGKPDENYKAAVKKRFVQWVTDLCTRPRDQVWLDYQEEIGLRHTPAKKNQTDHARTPNVVPLRYLFAFVPTIVLNTKPFLAKKGHSPDQVERMYRAWFKAVTVDITLWSRPYVPDGMW